MNVYSDKLNCYIEGIRIPILGITTNYNQNSLSTAIIKIAFGVAIVPKMWANALIQVTYLEQDNSGYKKEKLFFEGMITDMEIFEDQGFITLNVSSKWSSLNLNTTLDYVAPKRYGINILNEQIKIYIGNEEVVEVDNGDLTNYQLSFRYFFLPQEFQDGSKQVEANSPESFKLQFLIDRTPLAERLGFLFFEDIAASNFEMTQAYVNRFNLLERVKTESPRFLESLSAEETAFRESGNILGLDISRTGIFFRKNPATTIVYKNTETINSINIGAPISDGLKKLSMAIQEFEGWKPGTRSYRNNNPGNIEFGEFAKKYGSTKGDPRFAIFPNYESGFSALSGLITKYSNEGHTIYTMMLKYAPPSENDTKTYAETIAKKIGGGVTINTTLKSIIGN